MGGWGFELEVLGSWGFGRGQGNWSLEMGGAEGLACTARRGMWALRERTRGCGFVQTGRTLHAASGDECT